VRIASLGIPFAVVVMKFTIGVVQGLQRSLPKVLIRNIGQPIVRFSLVVVSLYFGLGAAGIVGAYSATFAAAGLAGFTTFSRGRTFGPPSPRTCDSENSSGSLHR